jgi:hypothetical protein
MSVHMEIVMTRATDQIYDDMCGWPYYLPYGWVAAPKKKRKARSHRRRTKFVPDYKAR